MGETTGFMKYGRELPTRRLIPVRVLEAVRDATERGVDVDEAVMASARG